MHQSSGHPACYTRTLLTWWEAQTGRPTAVEINGQRYALTPLAADHLPRQVPTLLEPVVSADKGLLLRLVQEWGNAPLDDCERALKALPEAEDWGFPDELVLDLVVLLARFYQLRAQHLRCRGTTERAVAERLGAEVA